MVYLNGRKVKRGLFSLPKLPVPLPAFPIVRADCESVQGNKGGWEAAMVVSRVQLECLLMT